MFYVLSSEEVNVLDMIDGAFNRLKFLLNLDKEKRGEFVSLNIDYLMENSELDKISHFSLRLLCMVSQEFRQFFVNAETQFFEYRIQGVDWSTAINAIETFKEELNQVIDDRRYEELRSFHSYAMEICEWLGKEVILMHVFHETHPKNCREYMIKVPFGYCPDLIRNREVDLLDGFCLVHCGAWKTLLACIFRFRLSFWVKHLERFINIRSVEFDDRINSIVQPLLALLKYEETKECSGRGKLVSSRVDQESELFPPCARNSLFYLRRNHRLSHQTRFQFTLFLKDIGMDVNEALVFWKDEYSRKKDGQAMYAERDLWSKKRSHYTYNIRHIYGMEGARKQYSSFSCSKLQGHWKRRTMSYFTKDGFLQNTASSFTSLSQIEVCCFVDIHQDFFHCLSGIFKAENKTFDGGCPFKFMSKRELMKFLCSTYFVPEGAETSPIEEILNHISLNEPSDACMTCFNVHKKKLFSKKGVMSSNSKQIVKSSDNRDSSESFISKNDVSYNFPDFKLSNPIQYYLALKRLQ